LSYKAVIGLGFGDEGKGVVVNALAHKVDVPLVARFNGGQQAGHTVTMKDGASHVFSNFGSGSFVGAPTYWSRLCTFDPTGFVNELEILNRKGVSPKLYLNKRAPVTTPYDKLHNSTDAKNLNHGTCGVGFGATLQREEDWYSLIVNDLLFPDVVKTKLRLIADRYYNSGYDYVPMFMRDVQGVFDSDAVELVDGMPAHYDYIFEGAQGLLLDQHNGFFPHVTRSNTGTENIKRVLNNTHLYCVTRAYQTRHGHGPMTNEKIAHHIIYNPAETNIKNEFQGAFRKSALDLSLLKYGIMRDGRINDHRYKTLVITCCDQVNDFLYTINGQLFRADDMHDFVFSVGQYLGFDDVIPVGSPDDTALLRYS
jgi:adenylosuccinate synthase